MARPKKEVFTWVDKSVTFSGKRKGKVKDEVWANRKLIESPPRKSSHPRKKAEFSLCAQLIRWDDDKYGIRLAYFKRNWGAAEWRYVSRAAPTSDPKTIKKLLTKTLAKRNWFRKQPRS